MRRKAPKTLSAGRQRPPWVFGAGENFYIVMRAYGGSLRDWRLALPPDPAPQLRLYLAIFADVLRAVQVRAVLCELIGEPVKQSAKLIGEPIKGRVESGTSQSTGCAGEGHRPPTLSPLRSGVQRSATAAATRCVRSPSA